MLLRMFLRSTNGRKARQDKKHRYFSAVENRSGSADIPANGRTSRLVRLALAITRLLLGKVGFFERDSGQADWIGNDKRAKVM